jgi:hypothetical protein
MAGSGILQGEDKVNTRRTQGEKCENNIKKAVPVT